LPALKEVWLHEVPSETAGNVRAFSRMLMVGSLARAIVSP
jgi:hypothetical protein